MAGIYNRRPWYNSVYERTMIIILLLSGQCLGILHYAYIDQAQTWDEAQQYCRVNYTDLATVHNMEELDGLVAAAYAFPSAGEAWIGLYTYPVFKWSIASDPYYVDAANTIPVFQMWASGEPANYPGTEDYCGKVQYGIWYNYPCDSQLNSVCLTDGSGTLGSQGMYVYVIKTLTWTQAQAYCREYFIDLVSIKTLSEHVAVLAVIPLLNQLLGTWIGLYREPWMWSDSSNSSFRNWLPRDPNLQLYENCAVSLFNPLHNYWMDQPCANSNAFICYGAFTCKLLFKITITSEDPSLNVNDPVVLEAMLIQMEAKLRGQGETEYLNLQWKTLPNKDVFVRVEEQRKMKAKLREQGETEYLKLQWKKTPNRKVFIKVEDEVKVESNCTEFP